MNQSTLPTLGIVAATVIVAGAALNYFEIPLARVTTPSPRHISVTGQANQQQANELARFSASVDAINDSKEAASSQVERQITALMTSLKEFGIAEDDLKTEYFNAYQQEEMINENGRQVSRKGQWRVSNTVSITLRDLTRVEELTALLLAADTTNISGPNFSLEDPNQSAKTLADQAVNDAKEKAEAIAAAQGMKLGKIISIVESGASSPVYPMYREMGGGGGGYAPGTSEVSTTYIVSFELR